MAVVVHVVLSDVTKEQYDKVRDEVGWLDTPPNGGLSHVTWWEGSDCHNLDVWESEEAFNAFGEKRLGPGMVQAGVAAVPTATFHRLHEAYAPAALRILS
jgi:hypothetical protein